MSNIDPEIQPLPERKRMFNNIQLVKRGGGGGTHIELPENYKGSFLLFQLVLNTIEIIHKE